MDKRVYAVDRIIDDIVVLEEINDGEILEVNINDIDYNIEEGNILEYYDNTFHLSDEEEKRRRDDLRSRIEALKKLKKKDDSNE